MQDFVCVPVRLSAARWTASSCSTWSATSRALQRTLSGRHPLGLGHRSVGDEHDRHLVISKWSPATPALASDGAEMVSCVVRVTEVPALPAPAATSAAESPLRYASLALVSEVELCTTVTVMTWSVERRRRPLVATGAHEHS